MLYKFTFTSNIGFMVLYDYTPVSDVGVDEVIHYRYIIANDLVTFDNQVKEYTEIFGGRRHIHITKHNTFVLTD